MAPTSTVPKSTSDPSVSASRCMYDGCGKKLGVLGGTECRCQKRFCSIHTLEHGCTFNYKEMGKAHLSKTIIKPDDRRLHHKIT